MALNGNRLYQSTELRQELRINPRLYQAMELLHMPLLDLQQHLKTELAENPFLELVEAESANEVSLDEVPQLEESTASPNSDEVDWEKLLLDGFEPSRRSLAGGEERTNREVFRGVVQDLRAHLLGQLQDLNLTERELRLGEEVIGNIEDSGLLGCSLEEVLDGLNAWVREVRELLAQRDREELELQADADLFGDYLPQDVERMLLLVQGMDPAGVGARTLQESILLQLDRKDGRDGVAYRIVQEHFVDLAQHRWAEIARALGVSPREIQDAADEIARLDAKPGLRHSSDDDGFIVPDLIIEQIDGEFHVFLNDTGLPRLRLSRSYQDLVNSRRDWQGEAREFMVAKMNSATWMVQAIEQRRQTMIRVMRYIADRQREFFERGIQHLRPLTLREVAEHIEMHESTVSRVTNEKFVQTPRGVFPLKFFFSSGLQTASGEDISARGVRDKIRNLVQQENEKRPLTDQKLVELLEADGVYIARRTVAKYREQLGILPARMRKRV